MLERIARIFCWLLLLTGPVCLPGCGLWEAWFKFWGLHEDPKVVRQQQSWATDPPAAPHRIVPLPQGPKVHLYRIHLPVGTLSTNEKIWRQLDEDAVDSQTAVMLAQNGLRAGIAPLGRWGGISKLIDVPGATNDEFICQTDGRSPVNVVVHPNVPEQIIVSIDRDNVQQGRTFERCDNSFRLALSLARNKTDLWVQLEPVVQLGTIQVARESSGGYPLGTVRSAMANEITFADMRLGTTLKPDQFLILAPTDPKANRYSIGTRFLSNNDRVPPVETALVFVPMAEAKK